MIGLREVDPFARACAYHMLREVSEMQRS